MMMIFTIQKSQIRSGTFLQNPVFALKDSVKLRFLFYALLLMASIGSAQHTIPTSIRDEVNIALSYYPKLKNTPITFRFKKNLKKSTMLAQPKFWSFFKLKSRREYKILISRIIVISGKAYRTSDIPKNVMIGWLGHELGHIMDYKNRSTLNLIWFGIKYIFSDNYIMEAERAADTQTVNHGMENYILRTKDFILNNAEINKKYKSRIIKYYLSPEEIMTLVNERDQVDESKD